MLDKLMDCSPQANSHIGGATVRLLAFCASDLGSTPGSDYKLVALVALRNMCERGYMSLAAYKYSLSQSLRIKPNQPTIHCLEQKLSEVRAP